MGLWLLFSILLIGIGAYMVYKLRQKDNQHKYQPETKKSENFRLKEELFKIKSSKEKLKDISKSIEKKISDLKRQLRKKENNGQMPESGGTFQVIIPGKKEPESRKEQMAGARKILILRK